MSQVPFVARLGDAIDAAVAGPGATRRGSRRRVRRVGLLAVAAVLVVGGTVAAAELIQSERLAANQVDCLYDPVTGGGVGIHPGEQDPVAACRAFLAGHGKALIDDGYLPAVPESLVACVRADVGTVVVIAGRRGDCERHNLGALPSDYTPAREKVARLEQDLRAMEGSAACIPPEELARQVQDLLDRSGWAGWTATLRPDLSDGPCGHVLSVAEGDGRTLELAVDSRQLVVIGEPSPATVSLLNRLSPALAEDSVARCFTVGQLQDHVRQQVAPTGRQVSFKVTEAPPGRYAEGSSAARYVAGCAILQKIGPDPNDPNGRDLVALIDKRH